MMAKDTLSNRMLGLVVACLLAVFRSSVFGSVDAQIETWRTELKKILETNIAPFWLHKALDRQNGGYIVDFDEEGRPGTGGPRMIVTQARTLWLFSRLAEYGYQPQECLEAAGHGYRFLKEKVWDAENGGFYWDVDATGNQKLRTGKHLYGQAFALYALSEYYMACQRQEVLDFAVQFFNLMDDKTHDKTYGGYLESFDVQWHPTPAGSPTYMSPSGDVKLMNTHLHLLEAMTAFYRAGQLPLARERLHELVLIQGGTVVRKSLGACTDQYERDWTPRLGQFQARVSYGHDLENIWLLMKACEALGLSPWTQLDLYKALFDYSKKYGYDPEHGGFFESGGFNEPADRRSKIWWVQAEALVSSLSMYRLPKDGQYLSVFKKNLGFRRPEPGGLGAWGMARRHYGPGRYPEGQGARVEMRLS